MNEEEAFIRAIVDYPGDDTARLVYADWLDDRDDPRGPYLRAEHDWVKNSTQAEKYAQNSAEGLDAVWVARISRPPLGVCCDQVRFVNCGPRLSADMIDTAEEVLGCEFPSAYRAFLLNYNAGDVEPPEPLDTVEGVYPVCEAAKSFFPLGGASHDAGEYRTFDVVEMAEYLQSEEIRRFGQPDFPVERYIPLANLMLHTDIVFLGVGREEFGKVYHLANLQDYVLDADNLTEVAASLPEFLAKLEPKWGE